MSVYMTEEEQLESIKKWWNRYGNLVTVMLSIVFLSIAGYRYFYWHQEKVTQQASIAYENMMISFSNRHVKAVRSYANDLIKNYNHSVYADVAHFILAKMDLSKDKLASARSELENVVKNSNMLPLKQIAKIRIARILAADKSYIDALKQLSSVDDKTYLPVINELKGDIYSATGQYQEAMKSYQAALDFGKTSGMGNLYLEMKTNEMAVKTQSTVAEENTVQNA